MMISSHHMGKSGVMDGRDTKKYLEIQKIAIIYYIVKKPNPKQRENKNIQYLSHYHLDIRVRKASWRFQIQLCLGILGFLRPKD